MFQLFKPPSLWHFVMVALANKYRDCTANILRLEMDGCDRYIVLSTDHTEQLRSIPELPVKMAE